RQVIGVADAERVLLFPLNRLAVRGIGGVSHVPGSHHLASAQGCRQTNHVGVDLQTALQNVRGCRDVAEGLLCEHTILGLTSSQVQLHDFEVVSQTQAVSLHVVGFANNTANHRSFHTVIAQRNSQETVCVTQTGGDGLQVQVVQVASGRGDVGGAVTTKGTAVQDRLVVVPVLVAVSVERVTDAKLEAREVRGLVHDHVVVTVGVHCAERRTNVGLVEAHAERIDRTEVLGSDVSLATEVELTPCVASQTESQVTTEQTVTLLVVASTQIEAAFSLEHSAQTVTQVFGALQTPTVARLDALDHAELAAVPASAVGVVLLVANTTVQNTVQGHGRFCLSNAGKAKRKSSSEQSLFHVRNLRRFE